MEKNSVNGQKISYDRFQDVLRFYITFKNVPIKDSLVEKMSFLRPAGYGFLQNSYGFAQAFLDLNQLASSILKARLLFKDLSSQEEARQCNKEDNYLRIGIIHITMFSNPLPYFVKDHVNSPHPGSS